MRRLLLIICLIVIAAAARAQAVFKGGETALNNYIQEHIVYPDFSQRNCIGGVVQVSFRVARNGTVTDIKVRQGLGIDLDDEALRVVKMTAGQWSIANPDVVAAQMVLPIRFTPEYSRCISSTSMSREQAITAYHNRQELENAVTNYYQNKYAGKADTTKEAYIQSLKQQLGFDDELIDELLERAEKKRKQGDHDGACSDWQFIRNIGSARADALIARYCK